METININQLVETATIQYTSFAEEIISGHITNENEVSRILDGMLSFRNFKNMLILYKRVYRNTRRFWRRYGRRLKLNDKGITQ
jgi:hypothetical protein